MYIRIFIEMPRLERIVLAGVPHHITQNSRCQWRTKQLNAHS